MSAYEHPGRAYCDREHPAGDDEADRWCEWYHRPAGPSIGRRITGAVSLRGCGEDPDESAPADHERSIGLLDEPTAVEYDGLMPTTNAFACETCYDTNTIDCAGREIACPDCRSTVKISGLSHGLGTDGRFYSTAIAWTGSTITFAGTTAEILRDVAAVRRTAEVEAKVRGLKGRNHVSSGAIAIERRVRRAVR